MLVTVDGIVIGRRSIGETGCFLDVLTQEYGVIEVMAHGIRKLSSANAGSCALFSYARYCLSKSGDRYTINSTQPKYVFHKLSASIEKLSLAYYFAELLKYSATAEQSDDNLLRFTAMTLYELERDKLQLPLIKAIFELRLASMIGFMPDLRACINCVCYEHNEMFFLVNEGVIVCGDCVDDYSNGDSTSFMLSPTLLHTMRYVVYSQLKKMYSFTLGKKTEREFSVVAEEYITAQFGRTFKTLDYYKSL